MMRRTALLWMSLVSLAGCSDETSAPLAPVPLPPEVVSVYPPARSAGIPYQTTIWVRFREPIVPTSANPTTMFLKVDTRRIPVSFSYSDSNRRVTLTPQGELDLRRTHTVEITTKVRTAEGGTLSQLYFWQFRTTSVRKIEDPLPVDGYATEGPFAPLAWRGTEAEAGPVEYTIYTSTDSAQVAAGSVAPIVSGAAFVLPPAGRWDHETRYFWRARARNVETGDESEGPVWSFTTLPASTPTLLTRVPLLDSGTWDDRPQFRRWRCPDITTGSSFGTVLRFNVESLDPGLVVADAYLEAAPSAFVTDHGPTVYELADPLVPCDGVHTGMPQISAYLAPGEVQSTGTVFFKSAGLISRIQGRIRRQPYFLDYSLRSNRGLTFFPPTANIWVRYYQLPSPLSSR